MHSPRNQRRRTSKLSKNLLTTKLKKKHFQNTEFYFYDKENFIRTSSLAWLLGNKIGSLHLTEILFKSEVWRLYLGSTDTDFGPFTHSGGRKKENRVKCLKPEALMKSSEHVSHLKKYNLRIIALWFWMTRVMVTWQKSFLKECLTCNLELNCRQLQERKNEALLVK